MRVTVQSGGTDQRKMLVCESCGRSREDEEPGWVTILFEDEKRVSRLQLLTYCPVCAEQLPSDNVTPLDP